MANAEVQQLLLSIAERYQPRYLERSRHFLGIHDGLGIDLFEFEETIYYQIFSPTAYIKEQVFEQFQGFTHIQELGISTSWIKPHVEGSGVSGNSCILQLTPDRLATITLEQFMEIPDCLARYFQLFGGQKTVGCCRKCGAASPRNLLHFGGVYEICCDDCLQALQDNSKNNKLQIQEPVNWLMAGGMLLIGSLLFALLWGALQQPNVQLKDGSALFLVPFFGSVMLSYAVVATGGTSLALRLATVVCTLAAVLAGNIWGFRSEVLQQAPITWSKAIDLYVNHQLVANIQTEAWFLIGGAIGAWCGAGILKSSGFIKFE